MTLAEFKDLLQQAGIVSDEHNRVRIMNQLTVGDPGTPGSVGITPEGIFLGTETKITAELNTFRTLEILAGDGIVKCRGIDTTSLQPPEE